MEKSTKINRLNTEQIEEFSTEGNLPKICKHIENVFSVQGG